MPKKKITKKSNPSNAKGRLTLKTKVKKVKKMNLKNPKVSPVPKKKNLPNYFDIPKEHFQNTKFDDKRFSNDFIFRLMFHPIYLMKKSYDINNGICEQPKHPSLTDLDNKIENDLIGKCKDIISHGMGIGYIKSGGVDDHCDINKLKETFNDYLKGPRNTHVFRLFILFYIYKENTAKSLVCQLVEKSDYDDFINRLNKKMFLLNADSATSFISQCTKENKFNIITQFINETAAEYITQDRIKGLSGGMKIVENLSQARSMGFIE